MSNMHHGPKDTLTPGSTLTPPTLSSLYCETLRTLVPEILVSVEDGVPSHLADAALIGLKEAFDAAIDPRSKLDLPKARGFDEVTSLFEAQNVSLRKTTGLSQRIEEMLSKKRGEFHPGSSNRMLDVLFFHDTELKEAGAERFCSPTGLNLFLFSQDIGMLDPDTVEPDYFHGLTSSDDRFIAVSVFRPLHAETPLTEEEASTVVRYLTRHEVGHMLGLVRRNDPVTTEFLHGTHCITSGCTMRQSVNTEQLIRQSLEQEHTRAQLRTGRASDHFCAHCLAELEQRYHQATAP